MTPIPVVDLFSGPGGLAEGFAGCRDATGSPRFRIALSVEKEKSAHRTLRLRAFLRQFPPTGLPPEYYGFLNGEESQEPAWGERYPKQWQAACDETQQLELGAGVAKTLLRGRIKHLRRQFGTRLILLGGPPCQSYSLIGRARNAGNAEYDPSTDPRQVLYQEYVDVLRELQPVIAIMENVKGVLSARHEGKPIFDRILRFLENAGGDKRYRLCALTPPPRDFWDDPYAPKRYLVRAEDYGVPQSRHRVFVVCVREDVAEKVPLVDSLLSLKRDPAPVTVGHMIGEMPPLRSRLSRADSQDAWHSALDEAVKRLSAIPRPNMSTKEGRCYDRAIAAARRTARGSALPYRDALGVSAPSCPRPLRDWIHDEKLKRFPNHEARGHMKDDLTRYLFAAAFARAKRRSPQSSDFPPDIAPNHANWDTGKFGDRFRVQIDEKTSSTVTSHISKDGHYYIHPDPGQCRSLTVREAARLQTFPDNYFFHGGRTQQYVQVGNAVPPFLARQIASRVWDVMEGWRASGDAFPLTGAAENRHEAEEAAVPAAAMAT